MDDYDRECIEKFKSYSEFFHELSVTPGKLNLFKNNHTSMLLYSTKNRIAHCIVAKLLFVSKCV